MILSISAPSDPGVSLTPALGDTRSAQTARSSRSAALAWRPDKRHTWLVAARLRQFMTLGAFALVAATGLACGGGSARDEAGPTSQPNAVAVRRALRAVVTGTVQTRTARELSGLAESRTQPGVLWAHNDSGDRPRVFALRRDGNVLADLDVPGARAIDWEDIAIRGGDLYLGDIGDNDERRPSIDVYRVAEPHVPGDGTTTPATRLRLRYPDGPHNAETLLVDPNSAELTIVTKRPDGRSGVYVAAAPGPTATTTLRLGARLRLGAGALATGGDVSAGGKVIVIRTSDSVFAWRRRSGTSLAATLRTSPCVSPTRLRDGNGEALALTRDGRAFFTVPEGEGANIRRYAPSPR